MVMLSFSVIFPRLKRRGPIEARHNPLYQFSAYLFPRLKRRGPIEATAPLPKRLDPLTFPRLKRRGPIEAPQETSPMTSGKGNFHV